MAESKLKLAIKKNDKFIFELYYFIILFLLNNCI